MICGLCLCALSSCSYLLPPAPDSQSLGIARQALVSPVTFQAQRKYQCGPAAVAMALEAAGVKVTADRLSEQMYTPALKGSLQPSLMAAARRHGILAWPLWGLDCLLKSVASGRPVVVLQNLGLGWLPKWHYALVVGYDLDRGLIVLHTGVSPYRRVSLRVFMNTWRRADQWGLVLLPPDAIPPCPRQDRWIEAAVGLERARAIAAARQAYTTLLKLWPDTLGGLIGLGNTNYALGDLEAARRAFERVTELYPQNGDGFNNLAQVLAELGECRQAAEMIKRAIEIGKPHLSVYRLTIKELKNGPCPQIPVPGNLQSPKKTKPYSTESR